MGLGVADAILSSLISRSINALFHFSSLYSLSSSKWELANLKRAPWSSVQHFSSSISCRGSSWSKNCLTNTLNDWEADQLSADSWRGASFPFLLVETLGVPMRMKLHSANKIPIRVIRVPTFRLLRV